MLASPSRRCLGFLQPLLRCLAAAFVCCGASGPLWACNVPVFRYALERWDPDPYYLAVFHTSDNQDAAQDILANLEDRPVNIVAEAVDVDGLDADDWRLEDIELDREKLPWAVLRYPPRGGQAPPVAWSGKLDAETLDSLTTSKLRQEVVRRLLTGESAVWVLVQSGDREKDTAALETLERNLAEAKSKLRIPGMEELDYSPTDPATPAPEPSPLQDPMSAIPLKIDFSALSLSRDEAAEQSFLNMLLHSEPDLHEYADEPMVFPVFGQGRALWALVGAGINSENIIESCVFLTGPCSCQIKHMNPGTDILIDFDWHGALEGRVPPPPEFSVDMLTAVEPRLDDGDDAEPLGQVSTTATSARTDPAETTGSDDSRELASAAGGTPAAEGGGVSDTKPVLFPVFLITGGVLGGLLLVVAAATLVLLTKKAE